MRNLHPLSAASMALNRGAVGLMVPFFLVTFLSGVVEIVDITWAFVLSPIGLVVGVAYGLTYYSRFEYGLTEDTVDISSGVVSRRSREIPYRRVQNVDVRQGVLFNLLGLAVVRIETAGGGDSEATLNFVGEDEADRLQREIRSRTAAMKERRRSGSASERAQETDSDRGSSADDADAIADSNAPADAAAPADEPGSSPVEADPGRDTRTPSSQEPAVGSYDRPKQLFELSARELLLYAFSSVRPAAAAGLFFLLAFGSEFAIDYLLAAARPVGGPAELGSGRPASYAILSLISIAHAVVITYVLSVLYTFVAYYGFRLGRAGDDLVYERGLLQRYSGSIPLEKVQSLTITDNPIQRAIDHAGLWIETAGYGPDSDSGSQSAVPLAKVSRVHRFTERLAGVEPPRFERPTTVARRRYLARYGIVATVIVALSYGVSAVTGFDAWYAAAVVYAIVPAAAHLRWTHLGYYVGDDHVVIRSGFWRRRTTVVPYYRVQTVSTRRSIFQRRLGLASLVVDTASSRTFFWSNPTIHDVELDAARRVHDQSRARLQAALEERSQLRALTERPFPDEP